MQPSVKKFVFYALLIIISLPMFSQQPIKTYDKEWKKIDQYIDNGLPVSALGDVIKILTLAKKEKQEAQVIKALIYYTALQEETREENLLLSIKDLEKELPTASPAGKAILHNLIAAQYLAYFEDNRWRIYERSETKSFKKEDPATWTLADFHKKISQQFKASLADKSLLQKTDLKPFNALLNKGNTRHLRPTLYDLLAHTALRYFQSDESDLVRPAEAFEINTASAFDPAADFVTRKFDTRDTLSLRRQALLIYQELIKFHLADAKPAALIDADLQRLDFAKENSTHPDKEKLYYLAVQHIAEQYGTAPDAAQAWFLLAQHHYQLANDYDPRKDTTHRWERVKALELCNRILSSKDSSEGWVNAFNLKQEILKPETFFQMEKVNLPAQPFRVFLRYRNTPVLYLRVVSVDKPMKAKWENPFDEDHWKELTKLPPVKTWEQTLPLPADYLSHTTEIPVQGLPVGEYLLIISTEKDFALDKSALAARHFYVSNISYVRNGKELFILHRETGQPLAGAKVDVWKRKYDIKVREYLEEKQNSLTVSTNGFVWLGKKAGQEQENGYKLEITYQNDKLFLDDWLNDYYWYRNNEDPKDPIENRQYFFFTDRAIYRPGQTVYFKAIGIIPDEKKKFIPLADYKGKFNLVDVNGEQVDSLELTSNEYGSVSGSFRLPASGLTGNFSLEESEGKGFASFSVEEYKRPKFFVEYEEIKGTYRVSDTITITGTAKAYAGNAIDGAKVKYRVLRQPRFIYPWLFKRWWQPPTPEQEIVHGELTTDASGNFIIRFAAIPDKSLDPKLEPVFDYTVNAEVTDINGETRTGETTVSVGYKGMMLTTSIPKQVAMDSLKTLNIYTQNMNGSFEPARIEVSISPLKIENRLLRSRYWERPEHQLLAKEEYIRMFPHDVYDAEDDWENWEKEKQVFGKIDSSYIDGKFPIPNAKLKAGYYEIQVTAQNEKGEEAKDIQYLEVVDEKNNQLLRPQYFWTRKAISIEPGESTNVLIGTSAPDLYLVHEVIKPVIQGEPTDEFGSNVKTYTQSVQTGISEFPFTATETDCGGFGLSFFTVKDNRFYFLQDHVFVPWSNKGLEVSFSTFRDKTLPGSEEKWSVHIKGNKGDKVAAEMLASMYDASLDQFVDHNWTTPAIWPYFWARRNWDGGYNFSTESANTAQKEIEEKYLDKEYDELIHLFMKNRKSFSTGNALVKADAMNPVMALQGRVPGVIVTENEMGDVDEDGRADSLTTKQKPTEAPVPSIRKNLRETAFFFPDLRTDSAGNISFSFTTPEALTTWKLQTLAHTKDLAFGQSTKTLITQKPLMVQPNPPRFLREGDKMEFSGKIVNMTEKEITGQAQLLLMDATNNQSVDGWFQNMFPNQYFTVPAGQSVAVKFPIEVPFLFDRALTWRIVASSSATATEAQGTYSDGEESYLPVLTNRMMVTETLPLHLNDTGTKKYKFEKLLKTGSSETLQHHRLTVEYTSNPVWYAVQSLPYLMEYPYECSEQTWNRYYGNALASLITQKIPRIKEVFDSWKGKDTAALLSNLQKNDELKSILLEETPWVLDARNESEQKKKIALLFDLYKLSESGNLALEKLARMQKETGAFSWFQGGPDDRYITQYILSGIGHLVKLNGASTTQMETLESILNKALPYLDKKIKEDYDALKKAKANLSLNQLNQSQVQYLYLRSFFPEKKIPTASQTAYTYFRTQAQKFWTKQGKYGQGMIALALFRTRDSKTPAAIIKSLKETSINNPELGRYWKLSGGWFWYQAPIETQALLIEVFSEISKDNKTVNELKTWLLKNKQTNQWSTTKATAEACYSLLLRGEDWVSQPQEVEIDLGPAFVTSGTGAEAGTGYFKKTMEGRLVEPAMGEITVQVKNNNGKSGSPSWGAVYWQYFEDLDKITPAATPLQLNKKLFVKRNGERGPELHPVNEGDVLNVGDRITVRIELRSDRDMEYVHMKDLRASALEPVNVLSSYRWQDGLGYYESTRDASTNFFFSYLRKGTYVFEYDLFVTHKGEFSNGVTTIQCMYAPEFSAHSEGLRIQVE